MDDPEGVPDDPEVPDGHGAESEPAGPTAPKKRQVTEMQLSALRKGRARRAELIATRKSEAPPPPPPPPVGKRGSPKTAHVAGFKLKRDVVTVFEEDAAIGKNSHVVNLFVF